MRRFLLIALGLIAVVPVALGARSSGNDPFSPIGLHQKVAVVVCSYKGEKPKSTDISVETWVRVLNDKVNAYYKAATGNQVSFTFVAPRQDPCVFKETYDETKPTDTAGSTFTVEDDPSTITREGGEAVVWADGGDHIWAGNDINRLLVIVDRKKRGRASLPPGLFFQTGSSGPKNITVSVVTSDQGNDRATQKHHNAYMGRDELEGIVNDQDIALIAHELGHQLGLFDLYRDTIDGKEYTEFWDEMAYDNLQNFSAFSRYLTGWLPPSGYKVVNRGSTPVGGLDVTVNPPLAGGTEAVLLPTAGPIFPQPPGEAYSPTFQGYIVEARGHTGQDATRPATYETGTPSTLNKFCTVMGTPPEYADGIVVSATNGAPFNLQPTNPVTVKRFGPRGQTLACNADDPAKADKIELAKAPFPAGQTFSDPEVGLRVKVLSKTASGGYKLRIFFDSPPPTPNLVATDIWLDSPANGFGNFWMPDNDHDGAPDLFGDAIYTPVSITLSLTAPPQITFSTTTHRLSLRVQNTGDGMARDVRGTAYILGGEIPVGSDLNADTLGRASVARISDIHFGDVAPGATATQTVDMTPVGPFVVALLINPNGNELNVLDNLRIEPFLMVQTGSGSPYKPIDLSLSLANINKGGRAIYASPYPLPAGWKGTFDAASQPGKVMSLLKGGAQEKFRLQLQPPDPGVAKPGQVKEIFLTGFMNQGDTFIPQVKIPVDVILSYGTALTLVAKGDAGKTSLEGVLTYRDGGRSKPLANTRVRIAVSALGGGEQPHSELSATTNASGAFHVNVETKKGARYGAVAEFAGSLRYLTMRSDAVAFSGTKAGATTTTAPTTTTTPAPAAPTPKAYGVADDGGKFAEDGGKSAVAALKAAGMSEQRWTLVWGGAATPDRDPFLDRAVPVASGAGIGIILALYPNPTSPPLPLQAGFVDSFCAWAARVARNYPQIRRFIVGNEVNAARFWPQQQGGTGVYYQTLKTCYDRLKEVSGAIQVIGMGLAPRAVSRPASTAPLDFIKAMGDAYRADGRTTPIMDALAVHPYPNPNAKPPPPPAKGGYEDAGFFGVTQLDRVRAALTTAFAGSGQPTTAGGLKLVIDEYGYQTDTTGDERYKGTEGSGVVSEADQGAYYSDAITKFLACDATVSDVLLFLLVDESGRGVTADGGGWQSGLEHPDGAHKPSFDAVAGAIKTGCAAG